MSKAEKVQEPIQRIESFEHKMFFSLVDKHTHLNRYRTKGKIIAVIAFTNGKATLPTSAWVGRGEGGTLGQPAHSYLPGQPIVVQPMLNIPQHKLHIFFLFFHKLNGR